MKKKTIFLALAASAMMTALPVDADAQSRRKAAVKKAANTVKKEITAGAPARSGKYAKSWRTKTTKESSSALEITVYSPTRYMLAHLLEHGHAKRNGGRVAGKAHIAPAEQDGIEELEHEIERSIRNG